jgi:hypothetical protein
MAGSSIASPISEVNMFTVLMGITVAMAHKPSFSTGEYSAPEDAFWVADPEVSIVLYHEVSCSEPQLWMQLWLDPALPLYLQVGVPVIDRLADYRPSVAVLGPGLPELELPFDVPDGLGGILIETDGVDEPGDFYEPFSQTDSWILYEDTLTLPEAGLGYIVAWDPEETTGKMWVATGTREDFTSEDYEQMGAWLDQTAAFHESGEYESSAVIEEQDCAAVAADDGDRAGCTTAGGVGGAWALVSAAILLARRRRFDGGLE